MKKENIRHILEKLDQVYGITKKGFYHNQPWQLLAAIMLSAQSTDKQVEEVLPQLFQRFRTAEQMAEAPLEEIEEAIRTIGLYKNKARNLKKCCGQIANEFGGQVPGDIDKILTLAGVGRKTATLFLADAYGIPGITVDTHVFRISRRLGWASGKNPAQVEMELQRILPKDHWNRINFQLIYHGREVCTARKANCGECMVREWCGQILDRDKKGDKKIS
ncbi:endonuclease III [Lacrimispora saccharolytica]|uniref:Endonuclease III n=1 Tax=Lacrimispora saccharolytica (strain ATCC 35040 / DSM 2544 / NRCC 2533 / WM1) TaxID=610130 RepID=D9R7E7_LACSW|nr:endonuclease III [Lacrimispora saccharolytica]ADL03676.1 endonuclease III [[Clostridium] saccharolyticum WM1]QRV18186.1 endonuclease III [Lacrimispora saccharolytica]